jgi:ribosomal protein L40E
VFAEMAPPPGPTPAEEQVVEPVFAEMAPPPGPTPAEEQVVEPVFAEMAPPPGPTPAEEQVVEPVFAEMAPPPGPTPAEEQAPAIITRLLSHFSRRGDSSLRSPAPATGPSEPVGEPWPHATEWSQRPIQAHDWFADANQSVEPEIAQIDATYAAAQAAPRLPEPEAVLATQAAEPSDEVPSVPKPLADAVRSVDFAEPVRVAAMPPPPSMPSYEPVPVSAGQQTLFDVAPATDEFAGEPGLESAAQPDAHPDVAEVAPKPAPPPAAASPTVPLEAPPLYRAPQAPAAWPPLGASWPARETPGAPWPGPEAPSVPAAVAAREAALPVLAGMWAQSAQEVLSRGSVRVCHHCALPVSTQARFCRRCGTKQA